MSIPINQTPSSIIIVGSGVFGLSTADALCRRPEYNDTKIVVIDRLPFPAPDAASIDTSRIVRADYANPAYAALGLEAQRLWRGEWGAENRYHEVGLCLSASAGEDAYVTKSLENVRALEALEREKGVPVKEGAIESLPSYDTLAAVTKTGGASGTTGYLNRGSGWADAESSLRWLRRRVQSYKRVGFLSVGVKRLIYDTDRGVIAGVETCDDNYFSADLVIVAAGAWSPSLVDLTGRVTATGQVLSYLEVSTDEAATLSRLPVQLNMSNGCFTIPPPPPTQLPSPPSQMCKGTFYLKLARHAWGYANPTTIPHPEDPAGLPPLTTSLPYTNPTDPKAAQTLPREATDALRAYLHDIIPASSPFHQLRDRPFAFSRLCHYADTPSADFLIAYHPRYNRTLFLATGGSGHGFKFLPVIGERIVDCIAGRCPAEFETAWAWKDEGELESDPSLWSSDGSRSGRKGMVLKEEMEASGFTMHDGTS